MEDSRVNSIKNQPLCCASQPFGSAEPTVVCCIIEIQKVAEQSAESCICILHKVAGFMERIAFDHYGIQVEPAFSP